MSLTAFLPAAIASLIFLLVLAIALWKVFSKAGMYGYWSLVPFVNIYHVIRLSCMGIGWFIAPLVVSLAFWIVSLFIELPVLLTGLGITVPLGLLFGLTIVMWVKLFRKFELKSFLWILCAIFTPFVGLFVIAFNPYLEYDF